MAVPAPRKPNQTQDLPYEVPGSMNYSRGGIGAIDAANPALSAPGRMTNAIAPRGGTVTGPGFGGAPAPRAKPGPTSSPWNPRYPTTGPAPTVTPRETFTEDTRRYDTGFNEDKRRYDTDRMDSQNAAILSRSDDMYAKRAADAQRQSSPGMGGISYADPVSSSSSGAPEPGTIEQMGYDREDEARHRQWNLDDEQRWKDYITTLTGKFDSPGQAGGATGPDPNEAAARAAAFARAKEQAGSTARAGLDSLYDVMASTGRSGSAVEAGAAGQVAAGTAGDLNDFTREQYIQDLDRSREVSDRNYQGDLTKRGQNMGWLQSLLGLLGSRKNLY